MLHKKPHSEKNKPKAKISSQKIKGVKKAHMDFRKILESGSTFQEAFEIPQDKMQDRFQEGCNLFERKEYEEAMHVFAYLVAFNPYVPEVWEMLSATQMHLRQFEPAIDSATLAIALNPSNPVPFLYAASCYLELGDEEEARQALQSLINIAQEDHQYRSLEEKAHALLKQFHAHKK